MNKHILMGAVALLTVPLLLTGCSTAGAAHAADPTATMPPATEAATQATDDSTVTDEPSDTPTPEPSIAEFGQSFTYEDGVEATVTNLGSFTPSESGLYMIDNKTGHYLKFQITVKNGSSQILDLSMSQADLQAGESDGEEIFDVDRGLNGSPDTKLLPGRTKKWDVGFGVTTTKGLVFQLAPTFDYEDSIWAN